MGLEMPPPLLGYNNNVRHRGRIFHIQTEDSGVASPRIMTHLFADGGRIVKSTRTDYSEHLGRKDLVEVVRGLMKEQHKAMFVALRGGELDDVIGFEADAPPPSLVGTPPNFSQSPSLPGSVVDGDSAQPKKPGSQAPSTAPKPSTGKPPPRRRGESGEKRSSETPAPNYAAPRPAAIFADPPIRESLFGETVMEKSLDETILSYLSEDSETADGSR